MAQRIIKHYSHNRSHRRQGIKMTQEIKDYTKNTAIEASAGTGKTHTITRVIVPDLLERGYKLSEILIVTYTEKAAGELRSRVRKELHSLTHPKTDEEIQELANRSASFKNILNEELEKIDDAPIFTIHSFCQKILTENSVYSNSSKNLTLIDENQCLDNFIGQYIRDVLSQNKIFMFLHNNCETSFQSIIREAVKKYYLDKNGQEKPELISLAPLSNEDIEKYEIFLKNTSKLDPNTNNTQEYNDILREAGIDASFIMSMFVRNQLGDIYMAWHKYKENAGLQTYGDIIKSVYDSITEPDSVLLKQLRHKYKYAIIDEFQDTNQLEWNIFKQIFATNKEHRIYIVGDPKQSIFSFQGADSEIYKVAKDEIGHTDILNTNYRSTKSMVQAFNVLSTYSQLCSYTKGVDYEDSKSPDDITKQIQEPLLNNNITQPVHFITETDKIKPEDSIIATIIKYCTCNENNETALQIWDKNLKSYRNVTFSDFTILARQRPDLKELTTKLRQAKIPFMWHKDNSLFTTKETSDWIALLSAIQASDFNSKNRTILSKALKTAFFDIPTSQITDKKFDNILCHERQLLLKWHNMAKNRQFSQLINSIFDNSCISERLSTYEKIQSLSKYNQIGNFVLDSLVTKGSSITSAIKALKQRKNRETKDDDISVEKATDANTVKLSTIHSAKGLEFQIVFYFVNMTTGTEESYVHIKHNHQQGSILEISKQSVPKEADWNALNYVAITRAVSLLFLVNRCKGKNKIHAIHNTGELLEKHHQLFTNEDLYEQTLTADTIVKAHKVNFDEKEPEVFETIDMTHKKLYKHSYSSLSHHKTDSTEEIEDLTTEQSQRIDKEGDSGSSASLSFGNNSDSLTIDCIYKPEQITPVPSNPPYTERGKNYGTIVHEVFEQIKFHEFESDSNTDYESQLLKIIDRCCKKHSVVPSGKETDNLHTRIVSLIRNTMTAEIPEIVGNNATGNMFKLSSLTPENIKNEVEFNLHPETEKILQNYYNGFIDLLFIREINGQQVYSILDWKTDLFDESDYTNYEYLKSRTDEHYSIQRVLYSYSLIQWLKQFYPGKSEADIFNNHFGGMYYAYVRGCHQGNSNGIYAHTWKKFAALEEEFNKIANKGIYNG